MGEFNTPLTPMDRPSKQKINKKAQVLNDILDEMLISLISSGYSIQMQKNTPYSHMHHVTFSRIYHILVHKSNFSQFKKIEILSSIFSEHNAIRLDINYKKRKKNCKKHNTWRLKNTFLNNQKVTEEIKREIKKILETNDSENTTTQNLWDAAKQL